MSTTSNNSVVVIGAGIAGLTAALSLLEKNIPVTLVSSRDLGQNFFSTQELCFNACECDFSPHVEDTYLYEALISRATGKFFCQAAHGVLTVLQRLGVIFTRSPEGHLLCQRGELSHRPFSYSAQRLGAQVTQALIDQLFHREWGKLNFLAPYHFLSLIKGEGERVCGVVLQDKRGLDLVVVPARAVILATGSFLGLTNGQFAEFGGAQLTVAQQGAALANLEFGTNGGVWVDHHHQTTLPNLFACGRSSFIYKGARQFPGNEILTSFFGGLRTAEEVVGVMVRSEENFSQEIADHVLAVQKQRQNELFDLSGPENLISIRVDLVKTLAVFSARAKTELSCFKALEHIGELQNRYARITIADKSPWCNQEIFLARELEAALRIAKIIVTAAYERRESRGVHVRADYPETEVRYFKNTKIFLKGGEAKIFYEDIHDTDEDQTADEPDRQLLLGIV